MTTQAVLDFWFGECDESGWPAPEQSKLWWTSSPDLDAEMRDRFGAQVENALVDPISLDEDDAEGHLATILLLDQFTRNIFRGTARAFAGDHRALALARAAVARGLDHKLSPVHRVFLYMPLEHAESEAAQRESLTAFRQLLHDHGRPERAAEFDNFYEFAVKHAEIIARFGRYPHRNKVLGRVATPEETAYLAEGGATFGQG